MTRAIELPGLDLPPVTVKKPRSVRCPATPRGRAKKGGRVEREIVALIRELGVECRKVPLSGALAKRLGDEYAGDVKLWPFGPDNAPLTLEVKARAGGAGFATLERWLGSCDALVLKRNGVPPMVAMPWTLWARLLTGRKA